MPFERPDNFECRDIKEDMYYLNELAESLDSAYRTGTKSGLEGTSRIEISDELAKMISARLRNISKGYLDAVSK